MFTGLLVAVFSWLPAGVVPASNAQSPGDLPFTVQVNQSTDLVDGQPVEVEITMDQGFRLGSALAFICRPGETYSDITDTDPANGKCPGSQTAISPTVSETSTWPLFAYANGTRARGSIVAQVGVAAWTNGLPPGSGEVRYTLPCGPQDPCQLVLRVAVSTSSGTETVLDSSTPLRFQAEDPFVGCGGQAAGAPRTAGADRMVWAWREWTRSLCATGGSDVALTVAPGSDEGLAVETFGRGALDVAYSAAGYGQPGFDRNTQRGMVPVPIAVNAVVLATAGGFFTTDDPNWPQHVSRPYTEVRLTTQEMAVLLAQNPFSLRERFGTQVLERNPELGDVYAASITSSATTVALSTTSAIPLYMTRYLDTLAPADWVAPPNLGSAPRGVDPNLALADPGYTQSGTFNLASDQSAIQRAAYNHLRNLSNQPGFLGPLWALTDLSTARRLDLTPVTLQNAAGDWVRPTIESLNAGVAAMQPQDDGTLAPDVTTTAAGAYPLTMVEYALVPAEPLVDPATCEPRADSQALLDDWLTYITGDGQSVLPDGFQPLPPALRQQATEAIAQVGASPSTCLPSGGPGPDGPTTTGPPTGPFGNTPYPSGTYDPSSLGGTGRNTADGRTSAAREPTDDDRRRAREAAEAADIEMPPYRGIAAFSDWAPPMAVLGIVALTSGAALATSGRPLPAPVTYVPRRLADGLAARRRGARPRRNVRELLRAGLGRGRSLLDPSSRGAP